MACQIKKHMVVVKGYDQRLGVYLTKIFSLVDKQITIWVFITLALSKGQNLHQLDINNVFLNGTLQEEVYISQPQGFEDPKFPNYVCKLDKEIYGLKQAPGVWFDTLTPTLLNFLMMI